MMGSKSLKKEIIMMLIFGFGLAFYQLYIQEAYFQSVEASGKTLGVFEVGLGLMGAYIFIRLVQILFTRKIGDSRS